MKKVCPSLATSAYPTELAQTVFSIMSGANSEFYPSDTVSGCVFFGTQRTRIEPQSPMMTMLSPFDEPHSTRFRWAKTRQQTAILINNINHLFEECIRGDPRMKIVTCYETEKTKGIIVCNPAECKTILTKNSIGSS